MYEGIDVHGDHGPVNWPMVKLSGITFAFVKATEGATFIDKRIAQHLRDASAAGVHVGPYHFARPDNRPSLAGAATEAQHFCSVLASSGYDSSKHMRPVLDLEEGAGQLAPWAERFCATVEVLIGVTPIIYTYTYFIRRHLAQGAGELARYPLWLANYGPNDGTRHTIPACEGRTSNSPTSSMGYGRLCLRGSSPRSRNSPARSTCRELPTFSCRPIAFHRCSGSMSASHPARAGEPCAPAFATQTRSKGTNTLPAGSSW